MNEIVHLPILEILKKKDKENVDKETIKEMI